jgi:hypothetical protein
VKESLQGLAAPLIISVGKFVNFGPILETAKHGDKLDRWECQVLQTKVSGSATVAGGTSMVLKPVERDDWREVEPAEGDLSVKRHTPSVFTMNTPRHPSTLKASVVPLLGKRRATYRLVTLMMTRLA